MAKKTSLKKSGQDINGILLLDKPLGISSNRALQKARYLFHAKKAGHTGSLDPLASGVLPICFGQASKVSAFLLDSDKRYTCTAQLGTTTTTGDREGEVLQTRPVPALSKRQVLDVLHQFSGDIEQIPPMHSALKHRGKPLYILARKGIEIERKARTVTIREIKLIAQTRDSISLDILCSKGTYIRTLIEDIGKLLGCGAHLKQLRRSEVIPFKCDHLYTLDKLQSLALKNELDSALLPIDAALIHLPRMTLSNKESRHIQNGLKISRSDIPESEMIRLYQQDGQFIGIGRYSSDHKLAAKRMMNTSFHNT